MNSVESVLNSVRSVLGSIEPLGFATEVVPVSCLFAGIVRAIAGQAQLARAAKFAAQRNNSIARSRPRATCPARPCRAAWPSHPWIGPASS
ncbi:hypothetical protein [Kutzneria buriramensis]|uniref:hypothetical protein n=1 Tax=Kutzneria buriramensis TaxID=1045776 RepID=UPI000E287819|nr:hypothetical protein [Kutzneria buriramensis]